MRNWLIATAAGVGILVTLASGRATAQGISRPGPFRPATQPAYSPYLNLLRGGSFLNNYYGLVQPQLEFRNSINTLQQDFTTSQDTSVNPSGVPGQSFTGHGTRFLNTSHYFLYSGSQQASPSRPTAAATTAQITPRPPSRRR